MLGLIAQAAALALGMGAGLLWPRHQQPLLHRATWINLGNAALLYPLRLGMGWLGLSLGQRLPGWTGGGLIDLSAISHPALQFLSAFLVLDLARYWLHRLHHRVPFLWSFHRVHHSIEVMDATAGFRMHAVDFIQLALLPLALSGLLFDTSGFAPWVLPWALVPGVFFDAFEHGNIRFTLDHPAARLWHRLLNNPLFHSWHHTREGHVCDGNYGNVLVIWDRMFGSEVTRAEPPEYMGIDGDQRLEESLIGLQLLRRR